MVLEGDPMLDTSLCLRFGFRSPEVDEREPVSARAGMLSLLGGKATLLSQSGGALLHEDAPAGEAAVLIEVV